MENRMSTPVNAATCTPTPPLSDNVFDGGEFDLPPRNGNEAVHVKPADGVLGSPSGFTGRLYEVQINGRTEFMNRQQIENLYFMHCTPGGSTPQQIKDLLSHVHDPRLTQWLENVNIEQKVGARPTYDPKTNTMVLDANKPLSAQAGAVVFEAARQVIGKKQDGNSQPKTLDEYLDKKIGTVAKAASEAIEFNRTLHAAGQSTSDAPLESVYAKAYTTAYGRRMGEAPRFGDTPQWADERATEAGQAAGRAAVEEAIKHGDLRTSDTGEKYVDVFKREWGQKKVDQALQQAHSVAQAPQAVSEEKLRAEGVQVAKKLGEFLNHADLHGRDAAKAVELVAAYCARYGSNAELDLIQYGREGLVKLLGPFGFANRDFGKPRLEQARLDTALSNYQRLTPQQRADVRNEARTSENTPMTESPPLAKSLGIKHEMTEDEIDAFADQAVHIKLPDGNYYDGRRVDYFKAMQQNVYNHASAQIDQIISAGPASLFGRVVDGERGAELGSMLDAVLVPLGETVKARGVLRESVESRRDLRPTVEQRAPASQKPPAAELQPGTSLPLPGAGASTGGQPSTQKQASAAPSQPMQIADTQVARALDRANQGLPPLDARQKLIVDTLKAERPKVAHNVDFELKEGGETKTQFEVAGRVDPRTRTEREAILRRLQEAGVGKEGGTKDQLIVRQVLLTESATGRPPVFVTADDRMINGLARLANLVPEKGWGKYANAAEYLKYEKGATTFDVVVEGRKMTVRPIQPVRDVDR
jgi:hypothetical protein